MTELLRGETGDAQLSPVAGWPGAGTILGSGSGGVALRRWL